MPVDRGADPAMRALSAGRIVVLYDDAADQGDLIASAQKTTPETVTSMVRHGGGLVGVALTPERAPELGIQRLATRRDGGRRACERTPMMVSVEARYGVSTGISSADRARTIAILGDPHSGGDELVRPGHVFPFLARRGGLLERSGRLEAAVDALRLSGLAPAATICDVLNDRGDLAGGAELLALAAGIGAPFVAISELVEARSDQLWDERIPRAAGAPAERSVR